MRRSDQYAVVTMATYVCYLASAFTGVLMHGNPNIIVYAGICIMIVGLIVLIAMQIYDNRR